MYNIHTERSGNAISQCRERFLRLTLDLLQMAVSPPMPKLEVKFSGFPETLHQGEVRRISMDMTNVGGSELCYIHLVIYLFRFTFKCLIWSQMNVFAEFL